MFTTNKLQKAMMVLFLIASSWVHAEVALTEEVVDRWMSSQKAITAWANENAEKLDQMEQDGIPANVTEFVKPLKDAGLYSEAEDILEEYDFESPEEWADVSLRIMHAMGAVQMQQQAQNYDVQAQIDRIKNDPNIPAEQKEMMLGMMEQGIEMMERAKNAPEADVEAIKPQLGKLMQFFEEDGQ